MKYILIADDEPMNQSVCEEILGDSYDIEIVADGMACLESVNKRQPDLLLLDVTMPKMDGLEVCRRLKSHQNTRNIPIILVSAHALEENKQQGFEAGADQYITKPFKIDEFLHQVDIVLNDHV